MTSAAPSLINAAAATPPQRSATAELVQETLALTRRLFLQLARRPSTLVAGVLLDSHRHGAVLWLLIATICLMSLGLLGPIQRQARR